MQQLVKKSRWNSEVRLAYIFLLPAVLFFVIFMFYPIGYVFSMALFKTNKLGQLKEWAGLANFIAVMKKGEFWQITFRSFLWTVLAVAIKTVLGTTIALLLNVKFAGRKFARMLFIIPWASSVPISAMLWKWVLDHEFGLLNHTLVALNLTSAPPVWLGTPFYSFVSCLWVDIWIGVPFMALVFLAGMQSVSRDIYESASVDGVSAVKQFFYITIPCIKQIIFIATLLSSLWTFNDFNTIYILTKGGPAGKTDILITAIYQNGFAWLKFSNAAVMAVFTFLILLLFSLLYAKIYFKGDDAL
jgi:multiple sugar transport system permease protein